MTEFVPKSRQASEATESKEVKQGGPRESRSQSRHTRLPGPKWRLYNEGIKKYEEFTANRWSEDHEIGWIEHRLRERQIYEDEKRTEDEKHYLLSFPRRDLRRVKNLPPAKDLVIWLAKVRDKQSWAEIATTANEEAERDMSTKAGAQAAEFQGKLQEASLSSVRRRYDRVEKYLVKMQARQMGSNRAR